MAIEAALIKPVVDALMGLFKQGQDQVLAPLIAMVPALAAWAVVPFGPDKALANINAGLLFLMALHTGGPMVVMRRFSVR